MSNKVLHNILGDKCSCNYCMSTKLKAMKKLPKKLLHDKHSSNDIMVAGTPVSLNRG